MKNYRTFEEQFEIFSQRYNLDYITNTMLLWLDFRFYNNDITLFIPSFNQRKDGPPSTPDPTRNKILDNIIMFDLKVEETNFFAQALFSLNEEELTTFYQLFVDEIDIKKFPFGTREDIIVKIAKNHSDYIHADVIEEKYIEMKQTYLENFKNEYKIRNRDISSLIEHYSQLIQPSWKKSIENKFSGSGTINQKKKMFIFATMVKDGIISFKHFENLSFKYCGYERYRKFIINQL